MGNATIKTCCWVLTPASPGVEPVYCGKPTRYKVRRDEDGQRQRDYDVFCEEHQVQQSEHSDEEMLS